MPQSLLTPSPCFQSSSITAASLSMVSPPAKRPKRQRRPKLEVTQHNRTGNYSFATPGRFLATYPDSLQASEAEWFSSYAQPCCPSSIPFNP